MRDIHMLRLPEVIKRVGLKRSSIYRLIKLGKFPCNYKISDSAVAWDKSQIDEWLENKVFDLQHSEVSKKP
jgi:prophage regulatory protein